MLGGGSTQSPHGLILIHMDHIPLSPNKALWGRGCSMKICYTNESYVMCEICQYWILIDHRETNPADPIKPSSICRGTRSRTSLLAHAAQPLRRSAETRLLLIRAPATRPTRVGRSWPERAENPPRASPGLPATWATRNAEWSTGVKGGRASWPPAGLTPE